MIMCSFLCVVILNLSKGFCLLQIPVRNYQVYLFKTRKISYLISFNLKDIIYDDKFKV